MKHTNKQLKIGALALVAGMYSAGVQSANTTIEASAIILEPVAITGEIDMVFGTIASGENATTVSIAADGTVSALVANGNAVVTVPGGTSLKFDVQAANGKAYILNIADGVLDDGGTGAAMAVNNLQHDQGGTPTGTGAAVTVTVTADLIVGANQEGGTYSTTNGTAIAITANYQ